MSLCDAPIWMQIAGVTQHPVFLFKYGSKNTHKQKSNGQKLHPSCLYSLCKWIFNQVEVSSRCVPAVKWAVTRCSILAQRAKSRATVAASFIDCGFSSSRRVRTNANEHQVIQRNLWMHTIQQDQCINGFPLDPWTKGTHGALFFHFLFLVLHLSSI